MNCLNVKKHRKYCCISTYIVTKSSTLNIGCGYHIRNGVTYKQRKDLDISFLDNGNEFRKCWIEILNYHSQNNLIGTHSVH